MAGKTGKKNSFEANLAKLEEIVETLENNELPLEEALALFQEGVALQKLCAGQLDAAEKQVHKVMEKADGTFQLELLQEVGKE